MAKALDLQKISLALGGQVSVYNYSEFDEGFTVISRFAYLAPNQTGQLFIYPNFVNGNDCVCELTCTFVINLHCESCKQLFPQGFNLEKMCIDKAIQFAQHLGLSKQDINFKNYAVGQDYFALNFNILNDKN